MDKNVGKKLCAKKQQTARWVVLLGAPGSSAAPQPSS
jgi:hypothetical protein